MFFILSKILYFLITPTFWIFGLLLAGVIVKRQPLKKRLLICWVIVFYIFSNDFILNEFMIRWEVPAIADTAVQGKYDVAIVLGGMSGYDSKLHRIQFMHGGDRLFQAVHLYKEGRVRKLLLDGGSGSLMGTNIEAPKLRKYLLDIGIPDSVIVIESRSRNTYENAIFAKPILDSIAPRGRYLLVTSGYHMRRALGCFNKAGIHALAFTTDRIAGPFKFEFDYAFVPHVAAIYSWEAMLHEWVGYLIYKITGYL